MSASKSLPARPSLESLRKQAKKLARDSAADDADATARVRAHLPRADLPLTQRNAQLVIAREYGFAGWQDLVAEVSKRTGRGFEWAVAQARQAIHDDDVERLNKLRAEFPALLKCTDNGDEASLLGMATGAYGDAGDPEREGWFTRAASAELLIDAGAIVLPSVCEGILQSRARGLLQLFHRKGLLPRTLRFNAALGDVNAVRTALAAGAPGTPANGTAIDLAEVHQAFARACAFDHEEVASLLLARSIEADPSLGKNVDEGLGRIAFIRAFIELRPEIVREIAGQVTTLGLWKPFVMEQVSRMARDGDLAGFTDALGREAWLLGDDHVDYQNGLIGTATLNGRVEIIRALFDHDPASLRRQPPPPTQSIEHALTYAKADCIPLLTRIWPVPDDLPHAAGLGDLARVKRWFDAEGKPVLGDVAQHAPATSVHPREIQWGDVGGQEVLDTALAWAVINRHFEVADFLLTHGANINTNWNSHEPASILHHLDFLPDPYESMQFHIDRGIDMTIEDYRWKSNARGWALYGLKDEKMAQWLEDAERSRATR